MLKTTRSYINSLKEKKTNKEIKLYDTSGNNPVELDYSNSEVQKLEKLSDMDRSNNLKLFTENMAMLMRNRVILATPFILGGLTIASFVNVKYIKTITIDNVYEEKIVEFDENSILSEEDTKYAVTFPKKYVDENIISIGNLNCIDQSSYATIYYGEGSDSLQVKFSINYDNTWIYSSHTNNLYQKTENEITEPIGEINLEYKRLIENATETFIKQAELSEEEVTLLRELVSNNENDIIVKIKKCVNLGSKTLDVHSYHWFRSLLAFIAEIILITSIIKNLEEIISVIGLGVCDSRVSDYNTQCIDIFKAAKIYKKVFLEAEENRILEIIELLKLYDGNEKIIADYEKRLALIEK